MTSFGSVIEAGLIRLQLFAQTPPGGNVSTDIQCNTSSNFFTFPHWYDYICGKPFVFPTSIPLVLLAVIDILLRVAGIAAVAYVVFGGVKYVVSQGEPDKVSEAKGTIINALVGLVMATLAIAVVKFLGSRLG